jgi:hypothetical protein
MMHEILECVGVGNERQQVSNGGNQFEAEYEASSIVISRWVINKELWKVRMIHAR